MCHSFSTLLVLDGNQDTVRVFCWAVPCFGHCATHDAVLSRPSCMHCEKEEAVLAGNNLNIVPCLIVHSMPITLLASRGITAVLKSVKQAHGMIPISPSSNTPFQAGSAIGTPHAALATRSIQGSLITSAQSTATTVFLEVIYRDLLSSLKVVRQNVLRQSVVIWCSAVLDLHIILYRYASRCWVSSRHVLT